MKKQLPWGRGIAAVLAAAALAIAVSFSLHWWQMRTQCADAKAAVLAVLPDVFGTNGTAQADFSPKYDFTCREVLVVEHDLPNCSRDGIRSTVSGLHADFIILDNTGKAVLEEDVTDDSFCPFWAGPDTNSFLPAFPFHPVPSGHYQLRVTVQQPARALIGVRHRIVARYELCGLEHLAAAFSGGIALVAALVSAILTTGIIAATRRNRRHSNQAPHATSGPAPGTSSTAHEG
jgi:hypothetical protein